MVYFGTQQIWDENSVVHSSFVQLFKRCRLINDKNLPHVDTSIQRQAGRISEDMQVVCTSHSSRELSTGPAYEVVSSDNDRWAAG